VIVALLAVGGYAAWDLSRSGQEVPSVTAPGGAEPERPDAGEQPGEAPGEQPGERPAASEDPAIPARAGEAVVDYVHDGDTLYLTDGRKVRLLGVNAPEVGEHAQCYGDTATRELRRMLPKGSHVRTVADARETDRFGRSLLFLFTEDGALVNLELVRGGYAEVLVLDGDTLWIDELYAAEDEAAAASRGLWGSC